MRVLKDFQNAAICCAPITSSSLSDEEASATATLFKALSDPARVRIVNLIGNSEQPVCVCDLTGSLDLSQPTVSFHLKKLVSAGLLKRKPQGTWAYYSVDENAFSRLASVVKL